MNGTHQVCTFCVMDSSNPFIEFDANGQCNCCKDAIERLPHEWWPDAYGERQLALLVDRLKESGKNKPYDAMIGLSGGVDSAYLAHMLRTRFDLRLLAVHVDGGWNTEAAVRNIEVLVKSLDIDLFTHVVEWDEMRDVQLAFLRASVLNQDMPQDHAFFSTLYRTARKFEIKHFLSGVNFASESIVPLGWGYPSMDGQHLRAIHKAFGQRAIKAFPVMGLTEYLWMTRMGRHLNIERPLNFMRYDKEAAKHELSKIYAWKDYGSKHQESRFTRFYQEIYLPRKFSFDKRRLHLSSLIVSGQLSRVDALAELARPLISDAQVIREMRFVAKKLGIHLEQLTAFIESDATPHENYPGSMMLLTWLRRARQPIRAIRSKLFPPSNATTTSPERKA
jgi:N-acetyl sugar amidotransferase